LTLHSERKSERKVFEKLLLTMFGVEREELLGKLRTWNSCELHDFSLPSVLVVYFSKYFEVSLPVKCTHTHARTGGTVMKH
jgi:hypothetical protein